MSLHTHNDAAAIRLQRACGACVASMHCFVICVYDVVSVRFDTFLIAL